MTAFGATADAGAGAACRAELDALPVAASARIDVEDIVDELVLKIGAEAYWDAIESLGTSCRAPEELPDSMRIQAGPGDSGAVVAKPVQKVNVPGTSGVVFVYRSVGVEETMTGFAAALVEYRQDDGTPTRAYKASELLRDEGWARLTSSALTAKSIERCTQQIEYFTYSAEGDITGELATPAMTAPFCEQIIRLAAEP